MKITKTHKSKIAREVLTRKFSDRETKLERGVKEYLFKEITKQLAGVPIKACDEFITYTKAAYLMDGKNRRSSNNYMYITLDVGVPQKRGYDSDWCFKDSYSKEAKEFIRCSMKLKAEKESANSTIWAVLNSCNTLKQLLDTLPELEQVVNSTLGTGETTQLVSLETIEAAKRLL